MYDDVLVPTDGGDRIDTVIDAAVDIARRRDATLHGLSVVDERAFLTLDDDLETDVESSLRADAQDAVAEVEAAAADIDTETAVRRGKPAAQITDYAAEADVDLIVIGSRGADDYASNMLGSVSESVASRADRSVLIVPLGDR